jgi:hypothetical protein
MRFVAGRHARTRTGRLTEMALWSDRHVFAAETARTRHGFGDRLKPWGGGRRPDNARPDVSLTATSRPDMSELDVPCAGVRRAELIHTGESAHRA